MGGLAVMTATHTGDYGIFIMGGVLAIAGLIVLPADLSSQFRFPEIQAAPAGVSESELMEYLRDRAVLEVLAQDVRAELAHNIVSDTQWNTMNQAEQTSWAEARHQEAAKSWAEYVNEGLISSSSLKVLAALSQK